MSAAFDSPPQTAAFDLGRYLARLGADALVRSPDYRRAVSRVDHLAFEVYGLTVGHITDAQIREFYDRTAESTL